MDLISIYYEPNVIAQLIVVYKTRRNSLLKAYSIVDQLRRSYEIYGKEVKMKLSLYN